MKIVIFDGFSPNFPISGLQQQMMKNIWIIFFFFFFPKFPSEELREKKPDFLGLLKIYIQVFFTQIKSATSYFHFSAAFPFIFFFFFFQLCFISNSTKSPKTKGIQRIWGFREFGDSAIWDLGFLGEFSANPAV